MHAVVDVRHGLGWVTVDGDMGGCRPHWWVWTSEWLWLSTWTWTLMNRNIPSMRRACKNSRGDCRCWWSLTGYGGGRHTVVVMVVIVELSSTQVVVGGQHGVMAVVVVVSEDRKCEELEKL